MINIALNTVVKAPISLRAIVSVDADIDAERILILNRDTGDLYHSFKRALAIHMFVVPYQHATNDALLVGILDNDRVYNCKFVDGVRAESVNANAI
ncbi:hypothetical protein [Shewanella sp. SM74]|uniref:hypothetical protein n=1 Tax=Shewanella sp. SM74 TaxID=2912807 RepID=UPI0021D8DF34|nr:hypothetical protein [Shewanella sp. SM74]MCU8012183.1 hypothetical protein [Shewanella sp. SM74]